MRVRIKHGFDIPLVGAADTAVTYDKLTPNIAVLGSDYQNLKPSLAIAEGDRVRAGEPLFYDRQHPQIGVTAPVSGVVREVALRRGRRLERILIERNNNPPIEWNSFDDASLTMLSPEVVRMRLLESGHWTAIRARPFERIPAPDIAPRAMFVTAIDTNPLAPDPFLLIDQNRKDFRRGVTVLSRLTQGPTYVCTGVGQNAPLPDIAAVSQVQFEGPHPAGLPGTHIHALEKEIGPEPDLWHVGYQDVIAIGRLFARGKAVTKKVIALCGPDARAPRLIRVDAGADLTELMQDETESTSRVISGSVLSGRNEPAYLGRYHNQITVLPTTVSVPVWLAKVRFLSRFITGWNRVTSASEGTAWGGMLPLGGFDRVWPYTISPSVLLRTLLIGDIDSAKEIGCLGLAEEDLALCTYYCAAELDYGAALRRVLQAIERKRR